MRYERSMALAIVFVSFLFSQAALAQQKTKQSQKWEYKIVNYCSPENQGIDIPQHTQQLGEEGWELVSTDPGIGGEASSCSIHYFKRPKGAESKQATKQPPQQPTAPQCSVPLDKAPVIRGLRLGMGVEEIIPLVLDGRKSEIKSRREKADLAPGYGLWSINYLYRHELTKEAQEKFVGVQGLGFTLFDGRVVRMSVFYEQDIGKYPSWTIDEWTAKVSNTFGLPGMNDWELSRDKMGRTLKCKDLEIETRVFPYGGASLPGLGRYSIPSMTITDPKGFVARIRMKKRGCRDVVCFFCHEKEAHLPHPQLERV